MDHIFGDSDDIDFGLTPSSDRSPSRTPASQGTLAQPADRQMFAPRNQAPRIAPRTNTATSPSRAISPRTRSPIPTDPAIIDNTPPLSRLIAGMKSSFLPREEDMMTVRIIALSDHTSVDPLFMVRCDDTTILVGSGFGSINKAGREYLTFPDMRLIFSEKDHIRAWILTDASIDVTRFESILPTLGFPPIYATRDVIASFRKNIKNTEFLESCRFFELFADGTNSRRIGDIECIVADIDMTTSLGFKVAGSTFGLSHISLVSAGLGSSVSLVCKITSDGFLL